MVPRLAVLLVLTIPLIAATQRTRPAATSVAEPPPPIKPNLKWPTLALYEAGRPCRTPWASDDPVHHPQPSS